MENMIKRNDTQVKRMEIYMVNLQGTGSLQNGLRACVVCSNDVANKYSPVINIFPLTSRKTKKPIPTHHLIQVDGENNLLMDSIALCEQIISINKFDLGRKIGKLSAIDTDYINRCLGISMGLIPVHG